MSGTGKSADGYPHALAPINPLTAEFSDPAAEMGYRFHAQAGAARDARLALAVGAVFYLLFSVADYMSLDASRNFYLLLYTRIVVAGAALSVALLAPRFPGWVTGGRVVALVEALAFAGICLITLYRPVDIAWHGMSMIVLLMAVYLFVPNRFLLALLVSFAGSVAFFLTAVLGLHPHEDQVVLLVLMLLLTHAFGGLAAHRFSRLRRQEYAVLSAERAANHRLTEEISARKRLEAELTRMAATDPLTGIANRRHYLERSALELERARRYGAPLSVLMMDVDGFKQINDTYGHSVGDETIKSIAATCQAALREIDLVGRFGGEEFAFTLPGTSVQVALEAAERLRRQLSQLAIHTDKGALHFTVSIGVAACNPGTDHSIEQALNRADQALYRAKHEGRNRVVASTAPAV